MSKFDDQIKNTPIDKDLFVGKTCQEASSMSFKTFIPCCKPATMLVKNRDPEPYFMCLGCAWHNVNNREAKLLKRAE